MTISTQQLVDILYKKLSGVSKTDTYTAKSPANEANASPQLSPGSTIWTQDYYIPSVTILPSSNTTVNGSTIVSVYTGSLSSIVQTSALSEGTAQETWATGLTNWISPQFGAGYQLKLYAGPPGATGTTPLNYTNLPVGGVGYGGGDSWYFDYSAGIVNFADSAVPAAAANVANVVYAVGARYTGLTGIATLSNINIGAISINGNTITGNTGVTFGGNITAPYIIGNGGLLTGMPAPYSNSNVVSLLSNFGSNNISTTGSIIGNISTDYITPYQTQVTVFNNSAAIGLPVGSSSQYPSANVVGYIRYNNTLSTVEFYTGAAWQTLTNSITDQQITPDGVNRTFTLNQTTTAVGIIVSINGTLQSPQSGAYSVTGTQITFAEIPLPTDIIDVRFIASAATSVSLDYSVVDTSNISVGTSNVIIDSFSSAVYRSAKYTISSTSLYDSQFSEVVLTQFNGVVSINTTSNVFTGGNSITFSANVNSGTINLLAQGTTTSNRLRVERTYFNV
jgi:hypothetical protein